MTHVVYNMKNALYILFSLLFAVQHADIANAQQRSILGDFTVQKSGKQIYLAWTITAGNSCNGISILRIIDDSISEKIGEIFGVCGNSSATQRFSFVDSFPVENKVNSYQLELGGIGLSGSASILFLKPGSFILFPNPAREKINIIFENDRNNSAFVSIVNSSGVAIKSFVTNVGTPEISIDELSNGAYFISVYIPATGLLIKDRFVLSK